MALKVKNSRNLSKKIFRGEKGTLYINEKANIQYKFLTSTGSHST